MGKNFCNIYSVKNRMSKKLDSFNRIFTIVPSPPVGEGRIVKSYLYYNRDFLNFINKQPPTINDNDLKDYLSFFAVVKQSYSSTLNQAINALKFYHGTMLKKKFIYEIKRPRKDKKLPVVLSKEEVAKIFSSINNIKHKAILMLIYFAGLRVGEVVKLKPEDKMAELSLRRDILFEKKKQ